jgi:hypothetical protein
MARGPRKAGAVGHLHKNGHLIEHFHGAGSCLLSWVQAIRFNFEGLIVEFNTTMN